MSLVQTPYSFGIVVKRGWDQVIPALKDQLKQNGFGVLTEIDFQAKFVEKKVGELDKRCVVFGACNPPLAWQLVGEEPQMAVMLPCNVLARELPDDTVEVTVQDPMMMVNSTGLADHEHLKTLAQDADRRLRAAFKGMQD